jgi:hypothetical protein
VTRRPHTHGERPIHGADVGRRRPEHEDGGHEEVSGVTRHRVGLAHALADVPPVDCVVDDLEHRVEHRLQRSHVLVRDHETRPVVGRQRRELTHHAFAVVAQPADQLLPGYLPQFLGAGVDVHGHVPEAQGLLGGGIGASTGERGQIALGGVDEVADDVAGLPRHARGGPLPALRVGDQIEHRVHLSL